MPKQNYVQVFRLVLIVLWWSLLTQTWLSWWTMALSLILKGSPCLIVGQFVKYKGLNTNIIFNYHDIKILFDCAIYLLLYSMYKTLLNNILVIYTAMCLNFKLREHKSSSCYILKLTAFVSWEFWIHRKYSNILRFILQFRFWFFYKNSVFKLTKAVPWLSYYKKKKKTSAPFSKICNISWKIHKV